MIISLLLFFMIIGILVGVHEFGHFMIARANGIRVKEFWIGMGPKIWSKKKGDTLYALCLLPVGGACVFDEKDILEEDSEKKDDPNNYNNAPVGRRIAVTLAGPLMNFILAYLCTIIYVSIFPWISSTITTVEPNSSAMSAGLQAGDVIIKIQGYDIHGASDFSIIKSFYQDVPWNVSYRRDGKVYETQLDVRYNDEQQRQVGILFSKTTEIKGFSAFKYGWYELKGILYAVGKSIVDLALHFDLDKLSGPVGIAQGVNTLYTAAAPHGLKISFATMIMFMGMLSANLGFMNLLPIPALDGGKLILLIAEAILGRPLPRKAEAAISTTGALLLMGLVVMIFFNDLANIFVS